MEERDRGGGVGLFVLSRDNSYFAAAATVCVCVCMSNLHPVILSEGLCPLSYCEFLLYCAIEFLPSLLPMDADRIFKCMACYGLNSCREGPRSLG